MPAPPSDYEQLISTNLTSSLSSTPLLSLPFSTVTFLIESPPQLVPDFLKLNSHWPKPRVDVDLQVGADAAREPLDALADAALLVEVVGGPAALLALGAAVVDDHQPLVVALSLGQESRLVEGQTRGVSGGHHSSIVGTGKHEPLGQVRYGAEEAKECGGELRKQEDPAIACQVEPCDAINAASSQLPPMIERYVKNIGREQCRAMNLGLKSNVAVLTLDAAQALSDCVAMSGPYRSLGIQWENLCSQDIDASYHFQAARSREAGRRGNRVSRLAVGPSSGLRGRNTPQSTAAVLTPKKRPTSKIIETDLREESCERASATEIINESETVTAEDMAQKGGTVPSGAYVNRHTESPTPASDRDDNKDGKGSKDAAETSKATTDAATHSDTSAPTQDQDVESRGGEQWEVLPKPGESVGWGKWKTTVFSWDLKVGRRR
ncbi:hypothetical protein PG988_012158 [Apiospora saccharicola]